MNIIEHNKNGLLYLSCDGFEAAGGVVHGFSTRLGGVSEGKFASLNLSMNRGDDPAKVAENYRRFCAAIGADVKGVVCASQVHGDTVRSVTTADLGIALDEPEPWQADGLVTDIPGVVLTVFTADCLPILLYDPVRRVVGAVHAGWRGTALGIAAKAVERMVDCYGCDRLDILAAIGPGISKCCFETHEDHRQVPRGSQGPQRQAAGERRSGPRAHRRVRRLYRLPAGEILVSPGYQGRTGQPGCNDRTVIIKSQGRAMISRPPFPIEIGGAALEQTNTTAAGGFGGRPLPGPGGLYRRAGAGGYPHAGTHRLRRPNL